jgi:hypothetical protein
MECNELTNKITGNKHYQIIINIKDKINGLNELEIAECFKNQYKRKVCLLTFSEIKEINMGIMLIGLNKIFNKNERNKK